MTYNLFRTISFLWHNLPPFCKWSEKHNIVLDLFTGGQGKGAHYTSALVMFGILAAFCYIFYARAKKKEDERRTAARRRMIVYSTSLILIVLAIVALLIDYFSSGRISAAWPTFVFWGEFVGLVSFGTSWITASHVVPGLAHEQRERHQPFRRANPPEPGTQE